MIMEFQQQFLQHDLGQPPLFDEKAAERLLPTALIVNHGIDLKMIEKTQGHGLFPETADILITTAKHDLNLVLAEPSPTPGNLT